MFAGKKKAKKRSAIEADAEHLEEGSEDEAPLLASQATLPQNLKAMIDEAAANGQRFLDLVDLLPPLPEKGNFDVTTIKKSLYFFS